MKKITKISIFFCLIGGCIYLSSLAAASTSALSEVYAEYLIESSPKLITVNLEGASLKSVLKAISRQAELNFIASQEAKDKRLTLYLKDVPLKRALDVIFKANNLKAFTVKNKEKLDGGSSFFPSQSILLYVSSVSLAFRISDVFSVSKEFAMARCLLANIMK